MAPHRYGWEHILYIVIFLAVSIIGLIFAKKYAKSEKAQFWVMKGIAIALLVAVIVNRFSVVFKTPVPEYKWLWPDSFCGLSSFVLSLAIIIGKKDNDVLHFVWLMALAGGSITTFYPNFLSQNPSFLYLPTISGLLHHSISATLVVAMFLFGWIKLSFKKWRCVLFGFTSMLAFGAFLIHVCGFHDAYSIVTPVQEGTPLTVWVIAPIYIVVNALAIFVSDIAYKKKAVKRVEK